MTRMGLVQGYRVGVVSGQLSVKAGVLDENARILQGEGCELGSQALRKHPANPDLQKREIGGTRFVAENYNH